MTLLPIYQQIIRDATRCSAEQAREIEAKLRATHGPLGEMSRSEITRRARAVHGV